MDSALTSADWSLLQSFVAVAQAGSLSGAARELGRSQPTLGRQIHALEEHLGLSLFVRHARGLALTDAGADILPIAMRMHAAMNAISLTAAGQSQVLDGTVRIAASVFVSHHILPPILAMIRESEPAIQLDLLPSDSTENLLFGEADIAVRMYRPEQLDIVTRHIGDIRIGAFAARSYLDRAGFPASPEDLMEHDLIGYDRNDLIVRSMREMGWPVERRNFAVRCDNQTTYWELVRAGCGIGFSQLNVGQADPVTVQLLPELEIPRLPVWLAAHQNMRRTPRIRRVWDFLAAGLCRALN